MKTTKFYLFGYVLLMGSLIYAQNTPDYISIKDSNGNTGTTNIDCSYPFNENHCFNITAEYPTVKSTTNYQLSSIEYNPIGNLSDGTQISISGDDKWSNAIMLPFNFCFYGNTYNSIIVGDNGVISFDTEYADTECPYTIGGSIPSTALIHNAIFGAYHDMNNSSNAFGCTSDCGKISYYVTGTAPFRKMIINYYNMNHFGCEEVKSTSQIVLYETTNVVDVYIKDKNLTCEIGNEKRALIGITNEDGTQGIAPENRNTGIWEAHNEAWRFSPDGGTNTSIIWKDASGQVIGNTDSVQVCPSQSTTYTATVNYNVCGEVSLSGTFNVQYSELYPTAQNVQLNNCYEGVFENKYINLTPLIASALGSQIGIESSVYNSYQDAINKQNSISNIDNILLTHEHQTFYLRVERGNNNCFAISSIEINYSQTPRISPVTISVCDSDNDNQELIYLQNYSNQISAGNSNVSLKYFSTAEDATQNNNSINSYTLGAATDTLYVRVCNNSNPDCYSVTPIAFSLLPKLQISPKEITLCDNDLDGTESVNLTQFESDYSSGAYTFEYYMTSVDAQSGLHPIETPEEITAEGGKVFYIKVFKDGFCPTISTFTVKFHQSPLSDIEDNICPPMEQADSVTVNLFDYYTTMSEGHNVSLIAFYSTLEAAQTGDSSAQISNPENYILHYDKNYIYVRFTDNITGCTFVNQFMLNVNIQIDKQLTQTVCDYYNDGHVVYQLSNLTNYYLSGYSNASQATYYSTYENYLSGANPITQIDVPANGVYVYVKVTVAQGCTFLYRIKLELGSVSVWEQQSVNICDYGNNDSEKYNLDNLKILLNLDNNSQTTYYASLQNAFNKTDAISPSGFIASSSSNLIYIRIEQENACPTIIPVRFNLLETVSISSFPEIELCDSDNNNSEVANIQQVLNDNNIDYSTTSVGVYLTDAGANAGNENQLIQNLDSFEVTAETTIVYVRLQNINSACVTVLPLKIKMNKLPVIINNTVDVCDFANDGNENITLSSYNYKWVTSADNLTFTYYESLEDANNNINPITTYTVAQGTTLYVNIKSGQSCSVTTAIHFNLTPAPVVNNYTIEICDNNADNTEVVNLGLYENQFISAPENYNFSYYKSFEDAYSGNSVIGNIDAYTLTNIPSTVYVRIKEKGGDCFSVAELTFVAEHLINAENVEANLCDEDSNMQEYVNLTTYAATMVNSLDYLTVSYHKTEAGANQNSTSDLVLNPDNFSATLSQDYVYVRFQSKLTGCYTVRSIEINIIPLPKLINGDYWVCDDNLDGVFTVDLNELNAIVIQDPTPFTFTYFNSVSDALNGINAIQNPENYTIPYFNKTIVVKATNQYGCSSVKNVVLHTYDKIPLVDNRRIPEILTCDDDFDGITSFDLTQVSLSELTTEDNVSALYYNTYADAQNMVNPISDISSASNINPNLDYVYVRLSKPNFCPAIAKIELIVKPLPVSSLEENYLKCPLETITLDAGAGFASYLWSTGETSQKITVLNPGNYSVQITNTNGCVAEYTTTVKNYEDLIIADIQETENSISVLVNNPQDVEYSMDLIHWQDSNIFNNLDPGIYTFYVRSKITDCLSVASKGVIYKINNFITPNGDGKNDTWKLCNLDIFQGLESKITIFDRYGKQVYTQNSSTCFEWDGKYFGRPLNTTSYWYIIEIADGRKFKGWIFLRNYQRSEMD